MGRLANKCTSVLVMFNSLILVFVRSWFAIDYGVIINGIALQFRWDFFSQTISYFINVLSVLMAISRTFFFINLMLVVEYLNSSANL